MKRVFNIPTFRVEEFTSIVLDGEDIKVYHLYSNDTFIRASASKQEIMDMIKARIEMELMRRLEDTVLGTKHLRFQTSHQD